MTRSTVTLERPSVEGVSAAERAEALVDGWVASALIGAGAGSAALGVLTTLAAASQGVATALSFVGSVGPLSGKTSLSVLVWLVAWGWLGRLWQGRRLDLGRVSWWLAVLILIGLVGTFPPFFEMFE